MRNPGQSLDEEIQRLLQEDVLSYYAIMVITVVMAVLEWWRWYAAMPSQPLIFSLVALGLVLLFIRQFVRTRRQLRQLQLARDGERADHLLGRGIRLASATPARSSVGSCHALIFQHAGPSYRRHPVLLMSVSS